MVYFGDDNGGTSTGRVWRLAANAVPSATGDCVLPTGAATPLSGLVAISADSAGDVYLGDGTAAGALPSTGKVWRLPPTLWFPAFKSGYAPGRALHYPGSRRPGVSL